MSDTRFGYDGDWEAMPYEMWQHNLELAIGGKRGQAALRELRDALVALPERKLISGALCRVNPAGPPTFCVVGALAYHKRTKLGERPEEVIESLLGDDIGPEETAQAGRRIGLVWTLAWELGFKNDEEYRGLTDEQRFEKFLAWTELMIS